MGLLAGVVVAAGGAGTQWLSRAGLVGAPAPEPPGAPPARRLQVACSLHLLADIVGQIGGDRVEARAVLPAGADPHTFDPKPSQMAAVAGAQLAISVGAGLDPFMDRLARAAPHPGIPLFRLTELIDQQVLIGPHQPSPYEDPCAGPVHGAGCPGGGGGGADPHLWLDPTLVRDHLLPALLDVLIAADPAGEVEFVDRANAYALQLTELDEWIEATLAPVRHKALISVHPTWAYLGRRYGLEVWAVQAGHGTEISPRHVATLIGVAGERNVRTVFREAQVSGTGLLSLTRAVGGEVKVLDPLGGPGIQGHDSYLALMRQNVLAIAAGLNRGW